MQFKHFRIPAITASEEETELNTFLRSVPILTVHRDFVSDGSCSYILYTVEYLFSAGKQTQPTRKKSKIDYREVLCAEDFLLFSKLREWRKETAAKEAVAVYTIFTNEHLAQISGKRPSSKTALQKIPGIGEAKVEKYGRSILELVTTVSKEQTAAMSNHETEGKSL